MASWNVDRFWQWSMGCALPLAVGSFCADGRLMETFLGLWEEMTPARWLFLLSSAFLLVGFARNSARLRSLLESQTAVQGDRPSSGATILEPCND